MSAGPEPVPATSAQTSDEHAIVLGQVREARETARRYVEVIERDGRYPIEAFHFLQQGLGHAVKRAHGDDAFDNAPESGVEHPNHVSGPQLCDALLDLARERYGLLARTVLEKWNIYSTSDFGEMVFLLVENDLLQKTDRDRREDFDDLVPLRSLEQDYVVRITGTVDAAEVHVVEAK